MNKHDDTTLLNSPSQKPTQIWIGRIHNFREYITDKNKRIDTGPSIIFILALILLVIYKLLF